MIAPSRDETFERGAGAGGRKRIRILAEITRMRRAVCNPAQIDAQVGLESAKLTRLHRTPGPFGSGLDAGRRPAPEAGRFDPRQGASEAGRGVRAGEGELFPISLKAGGTGLNLTGADYVIRLDPWWNPAVEDEATDRAHGIGTPGRSPSIAW